MNERLKPATLWMDTIRFEMDALEEGNMMVPNTPVQEGENVVYTIEDTDVRRLYCLARKYSYQADRARTEEHYATDSAEQDRLHQEHCRFHERGHILGDLFWLELRNLMPNGGGDNIGIRRDWQVVEAQAHEQFGIGRLLGFPFPPEQ